MNAKQMNEFLERLGLPHQAVPGELVGIALFPALNAMLIRIEEIERKLELRELKDKPIYWRKP